MTNKANVDALVIAAALLGRKGGSAPHEYTDAERAARRARMAHARACKARGPSILARIKGAGDNEALSAAVAIGRAATGASAKTRKRWAEAAAKRARELNGGEAGL